MSSVVTLSTPGAKGYRTMAGTSLLRPIGDRRFGLVQAQHLLNRAGFGGTRDQIEALQAMGVGGAVDSLVDFHRIEQEPVDTSAVDPDIVKPPTR